MSSIPGGGTKSLCAAQLIYLQRQISKTAKVVVKIHSFFDKCYDIWEGNEVMFIRSYNMFILFDLVKMCPGIYPKELIRDGQKCFNKILFIIACFIMGGKMSSKLSVQE